MYLVFLKPKHTFFLLKKTLVDFLPPSCFLLIAVHKLMYGKYLEQLQNGSYTVDDYIISMFLYRIKAVRIITNYILASINNIRSKRNK